jgi:hypothetical protein
MNISHLEAGRYSSFMAQKNVAANNPQAISSIPVRKRTNIVVNRV